MIRHKLKLGADATRCPYKFIHQYFLIRLNGIYVALMFRNIVRTCLLWVWIGVCCLERGLPLVYYYGKSMCFIDGKILLLKVLVLFFFILILRLWVLSFIEFYFFRFGEWLVLGFSILSVLVVLSAYNFLLLYVGLELLTLSILSLIGSFSCAPVSRRIWLKYFVLNGLSSVLLLLGMVCLYVSLGTFSYHLISLICLFSLNDWVNVVLEFQIGVGLVCVFSGLFLKLGVVPFHWWLVDIYENVSFALLAYVVVCVKMVAFYVLFVLSQYVFLAF